MSQPSMGPHHLGLEHVSTYHTTLCTMPGQLIFGRDMILNMQYLADWTAIKARKQQLIHKNKIIENSKVHPTPV